MSKKNKSLVLAYFNTQKIWDENQVNAFESIRSDLSKSFPQIEQQLVAKGSGKMTSDFDLQRFAAVLETIPSNNEYWTEFLNKIVDQTELNTLSVPMQIVDVFKKPSSSVGTKNEYVMFKNKSAQNWAENMNPYSTATKSIKYVFNLDEQMMPLFSDKSFDEIVGEAMTSVQNLSAALTAVQTNMLESKNLHIYEIIRTSLYDAVENEIDMAAGSTTDIEIWYRELQKNRLQMSQPSSLFNLQPTNAQMVSKGLKTNTTPLAEQIVIMNSEDTAKIDLLNRGLYKDSVIPAPVIIINDIVPTGEVLLLSKEAYVVVEKFSKSYQFQGIGEKFMYSLSKIITGAIPAANGVKLVAQAVAPVAP